MIVVAIQRWWYHEIITVKTISTMTHENLTFGAGDICECGSTVEEEELFEKLKWWSEGVIQIVINSFGLIGNIISLQVLLLKDQRSLFNMSLIILTFFDSIFNVTDILESVRKIHYDRYDTTASSCSEPPLFETIHLYLWPYFLYPLRNIAMTSSIYMIVVLATERYIAVSNPIISYIAKDKKKWKSMLGYTSLMVALVTACMSPLFLEFKVGNLYLACSTDGYVMNEVNYTTYVERSVDNYGTSETPEVAKVLIIDWEPLRLNPNYIAAYKTAFTAIITGFIPLFALIVLNYLVYDGIKRRRDEWDFTSKSPLFICHIVV